LKTESPALALMVLRTSKMEASLAFYRALGFSLVEEKHGSGPVHYSTQVGSTVMEIFPGEPAEPLGRKAGGATMLGFAVASVDEAVAAAQNLNAQIVTAPTDSPWGRRAVVVEPDCRGIELSEPKKN
jgi:predicted enzyme related to lactoylglutathione lyase